MRVAACVKINGGSGKMWESVKSSSRLAASML